MKWKHLRDEIHAHIEEKALSLIETGVPEKDAWARARREFGNPERIVEAGREVWGWIWLEDFFKDLHYAFRTMMANRVFTALAVTSLALGIGANTAVYSYMDSILLRSLPVQDPESLVVINWHTRVITFRNPTVVQAMSGTIYDDETGSTASILPYPAFEALRKGSVFSSVFAFRASRRRNVSVKGEAGIASAEYVSGDYFRGLGVAPAAGRMLAADDDSRDAPGAVVISYAYSQERFGGPANAVGQPVLIDNVPYTVVGVAPPGFFGLQPGRSPAVYLPMHADLRLEQSPSEGPGSQYLDQNYYWINVMARLRPGVSLDQAQDTMAAPFHNWAESTAKTDRERADLPALVLKPGAGGLEALRRRFSKPLYMLLTLVGFILAIACANIANLLLARATARRREMAVRLSIGAGRLRVIRQLLTESVLLASLGGALGALVGIWGIRLLALAFAGGREPFVLDVTLNWRVLAVTAEVSVFTGILFGLAPAIQSTRVDVMPALREVRAGEGRSRRRVSLSRALVVAQIALSLLMLVTAGLFLRTLSNLQSVELGFNRENVLLFTLNARQAGHGDPDIARFYEDLREQLSAILGVRSVSLSHEPLIDAGSGTPIRVAGAEGGDPSTRLLYTGADFFKTMQIPLLAGREIEDRDQLNSPQVALVSEQFARKNFGNGNPVGRRLLMGGRDPRQMEIIGVAKEAHYGGLKREVPPVVYIAYTQGRQSIVGQVTYVVRTSGDPLGYASAVRDVVRRADARVPVSNLKTQAAQVDETIYQEIAFAKLCAAFALLALTVACVGLYGTVSYKVARRTGEIGIRVALGARRGTVVWMVLREVLVLAGVGLAISVPLALALSGLVGSFLYGMKPNDPAAFGLAVTALVCAAVVAGYIPARRAARIDPMVALRHE